MIVFTSEDFENWTPLTLRKALSKSGMWVSLKIMRRPELIAKLLPICNKADHPSHVAVLTEVERLAGGGTRLAVKAAKAHTAKRNLDAVSALYMGI